MFRFTHAGDECLTIPSTWSLESSETKYAQQKPDILSHHILSPSIIVYEGGSVMQQARSLWRLELARIKWAGGYINWYHPMRIRHITTGLYLGVKEDSMDLCLMAK